MQCLSWQISPLLCAACQYKRRLTHCWVSVVYSRQPSTWTESSSFWLSLAVLCKFWFITFFRFWEEKTYVCFRLSEEVVRKPKLFFVSTSATTSTLQTLSICYVSSATPVACSGRKRRSISLEPAESKSLDGMESEGAVQPSTINREVDGGQDREGRFLLYWITTTSISTSTSFTTTYTVSSVSCTPAGGNLCG